MHAAGNQSPSGSEKYSWLTAWKTKTSTQGLWQVPENPALPVSGFFPTFDTRNLCSVASFVCGNFLSDLSNPRKYVKGII
jgi:hypothetical protein